MRLEVRLYALAIIASAALVTVADLVTVSSWDHAWTPLAAAALLALYILAVHFQFQVHSGWATDASTVPAVATALLMPPGVGMVIACIGLMTYAVTRRRLGLKGIFNTARM